MTYNKPALVDELALYDVFAEASKKDITLFVESFFDFIIEKVSAGDTISVPGFGKFEKFEKQDGTFKAKFSAFKDFKDAVNVAA